MPNGLSGEVTDKTLLFVLAMKHPLILHVTKRVLDEEFLKACHHYRGKL